MARVFPLDGLLRLRRLQQDEAAGGLAAANASVQETASRQQRARAALSDTPAEVTSPAALLAVAVARASSRSMLADLDVLDRARRAEAEQARTAFVAARARTAALEKLEARHAEETAADELRAEQAALDEIASAGWIRNSGEAVR